jgi:ABC-type transport system substrate-binding protein
MKWSGLLFITLLAALTIGLKFRSQLMSHKASELIVYVDPYWGRLEPTLQSTALADFLLGNVFDPLVNLDPRGGVLPAAADSWEISDDYREFKFHIRSGMRFSDGTPLTAPLYRKSLLESVSGAEKDSHNPNALDVLYRLQGFSLEAARLGKVPGLIAEGEFLLFKFKEPFRTAVFELTGCRYAPWVRDKKTGQALGTGSYQITSHTPNQEILFEPNPHAWQRASHRSVHVLAAPQGLNHLCGETGHLYLGSVTKLNDKTCNPKSLEFIGGGFAGHYLIGLNGQKGKLFSDPELRLAMQTLVHQVAPEVMRTQIDSRVFQYDPQFFPPFMAGRLEDGEAQRLVTEGERYVPKLIQKTKAHPLKMPTGIQRALELKKALTLRGLSFEGDLVLGRTNLALEAMYGRIDYDINAHTAMVVGGDPDGVYHLLGARGSLHSPAISRPGVTAAMEAGRSSTHPEEINKIYEGASRAILREVPEIHIGFLRAGTFVRNDRVKTDLTSINATRVQWNHYQPKGN